MTVTITKYRPDCTPIKQVFIDFDDDTLFDADEDTTCDDCIADDFPMADHFCCPCDHAREDEMYGVDVVTDGDDISHLIINGLVLDDLIEELRPYGITLKFNN